MKLATTTLERVAILISSLALSFGLIALLSGYFASHDPAGVSGAAASTLGKHFADLGHAPLSPGQLRPVYNSEPPTSGAHVVVGQTRDAATLTDDELLGALELGNVVIVYGTDRPAPAVRRFQVAVAGPFTAQLAATGQAIILAHRSGMRGLLALAWTRLLGVRSPSDPRLRAFAEQWLGRGAPDR